MGKPKVSKRKQKKLDRVARIRTEAATIGPKLKAAYGCCRCCTWMPPFTLDNPTGLLHAHHIVEVSKGGGNGADNLIVLCPNCHAVAGRLTAEREAANHDAPTLTRPELLFLLRESLNI